MRSGRPWMPAQNWNPRSSSRPMLAVYARRRAASCGGRSISTFFRNETGACTSWAGELVTTLMALRHVLPGLLGLIIVTLLRPGAPPLPRQHRRRGDARRLAAMGRVALPGSAVLGPGRVRPGRDRREEVHRRFRAEFPPHEVAVGLVGTAPLDPVPLGDV